jgi:hypothetical protein
MTNGPLGFTTPANVDASLGAAFGNITGDAPVVVPLAVERQIGRRRVVFRSGGSFQYDNQRHR